MPPFCPKGETGSHLPGALLPKPRCGSRVSVTCVISPSGSAIKPFLLSFCGPSGRNKAPHCAFPPNYLSLDTKVVNSVLTHVHAHTHTQYWEWITEHELPIPLTGSVCIFGSIYTLMGQRWLIRSRGESGGTSGLSSTQLTIATFSCIGLGTRQN